MPTCSSRWHNKHVVNYDVRNLIRTEFLPLFWRIYHIIAYQKISILFDSRRHAYSHNSIDDTFLKDTITRHQNEVCRRLRSSCLYGFRLRSFYAEDLNHGYECKYKTLVRMDSSLEYNTSLSEFFVRFFAQAFTVDNIPGALAPMGLFDPLGFAAKADEFTLKRYVSWHCESTENVR